MIRAVLLLAVLGLALIWGWPPADRPAGPRLVAHGRVVWHEDLPGFGGLSGLAVTAGGCGLLALGDRAHVFTAALGRDAKGWIDAVRLTGQAPLLNRKGRPLTPFNSDAEALAPDPADPSGARFWVGFEGLTRVARYGPADPGQGLVATPLHPWNRFEPRFGNQGFEALAALPDGRLLAIGEVALPGIDPGPGAPVFLYDGTGWTGVFSIPDPADYAVADAAFGPDGRLWILERRIGWRGFVTRIRRFALLPGDAGLGPAETLIEARLGANFEGMALWQAPDGRILATLVSDDNFSTWLRSELREFVLEDPALPAGDQAPSSPRAISCASA